MNKRILSAVLVLLALYALFAKWFGHKHEEQHCCHCHKD